MLPFLFEAWLLMSLFRDGLHGYERNGHAFFLNTFQVSNTLDMYVNYALWISEIKIFHVTVTADKKFHALSIEAGHLLALPAYLVPRISLSRSLSYWRATNVSEYAARQNTERYRVHLTLCRQRLMLQYRLERSYLSTAAGVHVFFTITMPYCLGTKLW
jgi:hypothetical protein